MVKLHRETKRRHAIVIGGGIAGLLAARILTDHFERVTIIERDHYPKEPVFRPGIPQGRQLHTTLLRGQRIIETLFPGLKTKLLAHGAVERYYGSESLYYYGGRCPLIPPVLHGWNCTRLLLEWQIRQELAAYPQLHALEGYEVVHLLYDQSTQAVYGVRMRVRNHQTLTNDIEDIEGDLVIDASGVSSHTLQWLKELGYEVPPVSVSTSNIGYATRFYDPPSQFQADWKGIVIAGTEHNRRSGTLMEIEGGRWMVMLAGARTDYPPTKNADYLAFAHSLPDQSLYEAIKEATAISPIYGYRRIENRFRHFERLRRQPEGFIVVGDALCSFNPVYGQGITVAALEAVTLDACLHSFKRQKKFARIFQRKVARVIAFSWRVATASDARIEEQKAKGFSQRYTENLVALLPRDKTVMLTFLEVAHMIRSPLALLHPVIIAKAFYMSLTKSRDL